MLLPRCCFLLPPRQPAVSPPPFECSRMPAATGEIRGQIVFSNLFDFDSYFVAKLGTAESSGRRLNHDGPHITGYLLSLVSTNSSLGLGTAYLGVGGEEGGGW